MATAVLAHLLISVIHGVAHANARVPLSAAANLFVFVVILAGPLVGLAVSWRAQRFGGLVVALTMAASLIFGVVNHFIVDSPDHVSHVVEQWRALFATTARLLTVTELLGFGLALALVTTLRQTASAFPR